MMEPDSDLDALSLQVIALLQSDGRISIREMASRLGVAPATVRARYNLLCDEGAVQIVAAPNPRKLGINFHALVATRLKPGFLEAAVAALQSKPEVTWIGLTLGEHGIVFEVVARDAQAFGAYQERLLAKLPGYLSADVSVIWDVRKFRYAMAPFEPETDRTGKARARSTEPKGAKARQGPRRASADTRSKSRPSVKRALPAQQ